mgnify:CR=1 FL=1
MENTVKKEFVGKVVSDKNNKTILPNNLFIIIFIL